MFKVKKNIKLSFCYLLPLLIEPAESNFSIKVYGGSPDCCLNFSILNYYFKKKGPSMTRSWEGFLHKSDLYVLENNPKTSKN